MTNRTPHRTELSDADSVEFAPHVLLMPGEAGARPFIPAREVVTTLLRQAKAGRPWRLLPRRRVVNRSFIALSLPLAAFFSQTQQEYRQHAAAASVSPLIFGTNLALYDENDQFIRSQATRYALQSIHVQLIRMPIRGVGGPSPSEVQAMQDIYAMGVTPLIVLKFTQPDPLGAAQQVLQQAESVFGDQRTIYIEFGNERDLSGVDQTQYTNTWNQVIARVKTQYPNAMFGGPANFQYNPQYVAYFVHNAVPKPDFISWHEYTCGGGNSAQYCINHIGNWASHISLTDSAIQEDGDSVPPIFITEWNYDPTNPSPDPRATPQFEQAFTRAALQELAHSGVTGATQYVATGHMEYNLIDPNNNLTAEGQAFGQLYDQLVTPSGADSPTSLTNPTLPVSPTPTTVPSHAHSRCGANYYAHIAINALCPFSASHHVSNRQTSSPFTRGEGADGMPERSWVRSGVWSRS